MRVVPLHNGKHAIIDDEDWECIAPIFWSLNNSGYVTASKGSMHRMVLGYTGHLDVAHKNHDKLDNRKDNLEILTHAENQTKSRLRRDNSSGHKWVYKVPHGWIAQIYRNGKATHLGSFTTIEAAVAARQQAERNYCE